jgi:hypothetical protein
MGFWCHQGHQGHQICIFLSNGVLKGAIVVSRFLFNWIYSARRTFCCPPFICGKINGFYDLINKSQRYLMNESSAKNTPTNGSSTYHNLPVGKKQ